MIKPRHSSESWTTGHTVRTVIVCVLLAVLTVALVFTGCAYAQVANKIQTQAINIPMVSSPGKRTIVYEPVTLTPVHR